MIHVERSPDAADLPIYVQASVKAANGNKVSRYAREREAAIAFFTDPAHYFNDAKLVEKSFGFSVYKDKALTAVLAKNFCKKCAYCESRFGAVTPGDIEHYRPKSSIHTGAAELKPGYYWLAGDWENLLLSCPHCNRVRNHEVPGQSQNILLGKGSQFPLSDESKRVRKHDGDVTSESSSRLLLNPSVDRPEEHLSFDEAGLVRPKLGGTQGAIGKASIDAYALQRKELVEARRDEVNELRSKVDDLQRLVRQHNELVAIGLASAHMRTANLEHITKVAGGIRSMMLILAQYLAPKRQWIAEADVRGEFETLRRFGIDLTTLLP